jgi:hypothetical protein
MELLLLPIGHIRDYCVSIYVQIPYRGFYAPFYAKKLYKSFKLLVVLKSYFTNHLIASRLKNILCFY